MNHTIVVLVGSVHRGVMEALAYAKSLAPNHLVAMSIVSDDEEQERIEKVWAERHIDVPLEIVHSPYRELSRPVMRFIDELDARYENDIVTVVIPEFVVTVVVGSSAAQPERAAAQGPAAVPQGDRRDLGPVPPGELTRDLDASGRCGRELRSAPCILDRRCSRR